MRGIGRLLGVYPSTVAKLLADAGQAAIEYHMNAAHGISGERTIEIDEMWSFVYAKEKTLAEFERRPWGTGSIWTWVAIDTESRFIVSYLLSSDRSTESALYILRDVKRRLEQEPLLVTDALHSYAQAARILLGPDGQHVMSKTGTSHVERQNLSMRMGMRRFMRKTNGFSKRIGMHACMAALWFYYYNFIRGHGSLSGCTPAMALGLERTFLSFEHLVELINAKAANPVQEAA